MGQTQTEARNGVGPLWTGTLACINTVMVNKHGSKQDDGNHEALRRVCVTACLGPAWDPLLPRVANALDVERTVNASRVARPSGRHTRHGGWFVGLPTLPLPFGCTTWRLRAREVGRANRPTLANLFQARELPFALAAQSGPSLHSTQH